MSAILYAMDSKSNSNSNLGAPRAKSLKQRYVEAQKEKLRQQNEKEKELIPDTVILAKIDTTMPLDEQAIVEEENLAILEDMKRFEAEIERTFPKDFVKILKRLAYYLCKVGLEFEEACLMVRFDPIDMAKKIKEHPVIKDLIDIKVLEYKTGLIKTVSDTALGGDQKMAMWLLERRFPGEFNPKKGTGKSNSDDLDLLKEAVEHVRKSEEGQPLIKNESGDFKDSTPEEIVQTLNDVLK